MEKGLDSALVTEIIAAIDDQARWRRVLAAILGLTGAKAAIITLRENKTCQIVDDVQLQQEHHSPFVEGFELERVAYYVYNLRMKDVWADAQVDHRPIVPTQMSTLVSSEEFAKTELGQWCFDQGINDTIVVQIGQVPGYWTALNVFFNNNDAGGADNIMALLNDHLSVIKNAWKTGREIVRTRQTGKGLLEFLSDQSIAACLLDRTGKVTGSNKEFGQLKDQGIVRVGSPSNRLSLSDSVERNGMEAEISAQIGTHADEAGGQPFGVSVRPIAADPLYEGMQEPELLLLLEPARPGQGALRRRLGPKLGTLTAQERRLFDAILAGGSVPEAGEKIGVGRSRAFEIWRAVKEKLGVQNAGQLRVYGEDTSPVEQSN